jgi:hypothetical protein
MLAVNDVIVFNLVILIVRSILRLLGSFTYPGMEPPTLNCHRIVLSKSASMCAVARGCCYGLVQSSAGTN